MPEQLTEAELATNKITMEHIKMVRMLLYRMIVDLERRADEHDKSKLERPEVEIITEYTPKLAGCTYGSDEYKGYLIAMKPALEHHYAANSHHPEHYPNGVNDMNILDVLEMFCDWAAACKRHNDGDINESIKINTKRFGLSEQLAAILSNSVPLLEVPEYSGPPAIIPNPQDRFA